MKCLSVFQVVFMMLHTTQATPTGERGASSCCHNQVKQTLSSDIGRYLNVVDLATLDRHLRGTQVQE
jgi:hypothetical protein